MRSKILQRILNETPKETEIFIDWYADLVLRINQILREKKITQKALAEKMDKKPSEISKWLGGEHNFTLRSLAKLSAELGEPLLLVPKKQAPPDYVEDGVLVKHHIFVSRTQQHKITEAKNWQLAGAVKDMDELSYAG